MKEIKTITLDQAFFGEKKFTLEEYQKRLNPMICFPNAMLANL